MRENGLKDHLKVIGLQAANISCVKKFSNKFEGIQTNDLLAVVPQPATSPFPYSRSSSRPCLFWPKQIGRIWEEGLTLEKSSNK